MTTDQECVERFLGAYSGHTVAAYRSDLADFVRYLDRRSLLTASRADVEGYIQSMGDLSRSTVSRRLTSLAGFYKRAIEDGVIRDDPVRLVRRPKVSQESPTTGLTLEEAKRLQECADARTPRASALVALLLCNGLRVSEAIGLRWEDVGSERGIPTMTVVRKGGRRDVLPLSEAVKVRLDLLGADGGYVFHTSTGAAMDRQMARHLIRHLAAEAVPGKRIHPHSLRHTFVTLALDAGTPLHIVQDAAGHRSADTTRRYDRARNQLDNNPTFALASALGM